MFYADEYDQLAAENDNFDWHVALSDPQPALPADQPMEMDWDLAYVFNEARHLSELTGGAYDVTVSLVELGALVRQVPADRPSAERIAMVLEAVGLDQLLWQPETRTLVKRDPSAALGAVFYAKGYGVDLAADTLDELGVRKFTLEGLRRITTEGLSPRGDSWRIGRSARNLGRAAFRLRQTDAG